MDGGLAEFSQFSLFQSSGLSAAASALVSSSGPKSEPLTMDAEEAETFCRDWLSELNSKEAPFSRAEMNNLIMDYMLKEGYKEAAEKFQHETGAKPDSFLIENLNVRVQIRDAIQEGDMMQAIEIITDNYPDLLDNDPSLHFLLQQQHLIELIRTGNAEKALEYAQLHLAQHAERKDSAAASLLEDLEKVMLLLAFDKPENSTSKDLLELSHRQKVASRVNKAILELEGKESSSQLSIFVKLLLWVQNELDANQVGPYPKMTDMTTGTVAQIGLTSAPGSSGASISKAAAAGSSTSGLGIAASMSAAAAAAAAAGSSAGGISSAALPTSLQSIAQAAILTTSST